MTHTLVAKRSSGEGNTLQLEMPESARKIWPHLIVKSKTCRLQEMRMLVSE